MQQGLFSLDLSNYDTTAEPTRSEPVEMPAAFLLRLKKTRAGQDILVCSQHPAPQAAIDEADQKKLPLFTFHEVDLMRGCDPELVKQIVMVKLTIPGADVRQIIAGAGA